jgi:peptidoglycan/LPS O-acetylase OafA/YrhL
MQIFWMFGHVLHFPETKIGLVLATVSKIAAALVLSWASYRWVEAPILRLKDKWFVSKPTVAPVRPAPAVVT